MQDWISAISAVMQGLIALAAFVLSWVVWKSGENSSKVEYMRSLQESWVTANATVLANENFCRISDELLGHESTKKEDDYHIKRYICFMYLNILEAGFLGHESKLVFDDFNDEISKDMLVSLMKNDIVLEILDSGGFSQRFSKYCDSLRGGKSA